RGVEGKIEAIRYAREEEVPFFGICLGMQLATVEFARNVVGLKGAHSSELDPESPHKIIALLADQTEDMTLGGTLRLGLYPAKLSEGSLVRDLYDGSEMIEERHRHRYEFNKIGRASCRERVEI